jgi:hypothetical protein
MKLQESHFRRVVATCTCAFKKSKYFCCSWFAMLLFWFERISLNLPIPCKVVSCLKSPERMVIHSVLQLWMYDITTNRSNHIGIDAWDWYFRGDLWAC